jgi:hypothetical protein
MAKQKNLRELFHDTLKDIWKPSSGCRLARGGTSRRALRNLSLRYAEDMGARTGVSGSGQVARWLRKQIETQPYTTAIGALAIGWLFGRLLRAR